MKKAIIILQMALTLPLFGQKGFKIQKNVDEFTGKSTYSTNWMKLNDPTWKDGTIAFIRLIKVDDIYSFGLKTTTHCNVLTVDEGQEFLIKLEDETILTLKNIFHKMTQVGDGVIGFRGSQAMAIDLMVTITPAQIYALSQSQIVRCRLDTGDGLLDFGPEKKEWSEDIMANFKIICTSIKIE